MAPKRGHTYHREEIRALREIEIFVAKVGEAGLLAREHDDFGLCAGQHGRSGGAGVCMRTVSRWN